MTNYEILRRAVRALDGIDKVTLRAVTPDAMRRVCIARGWALGGPEPWHGDHTKIAFEVYEHDTAHGRNRRKGWEACVKIPMDMTFADYAARVVDWAEAVASRHGDVAPAEILAEAVEASGL